MINKLRLHNTYSRTLEDFEALDPEGKNVTFYSCGPTVYSLAHIGNFRSFLLADVLRRTVERNGYRVRHVMNITDVGHLTVDDMADAAGEDKIGQAALQNNTTPEALARHFEAEFVTDAKALRLLNYSGAEANEPSLHPRATESIPEMLFLIQKLLDSNNAYVDESGQVYFDVGSFPEYGRLAGKQLSELESGARVAVRAEKRNAHDFALWKVDPKHLMQWDPHAPRTWPEDAQRRLRELLPDGIDARVQRGFPGWHIECSAMSYTNLGVPIDIHTGGEDNVFPHHECENAQTCAALKTTVPAPGGAGSRTTFARYWVHARHLLVDGKKMSKREGTLLTVRGLIAPNMAETNPTTTGLRSIGLSSGVSAQVLRYALLANHYAAPVNFTFDYLEQANSNILRIQSLADRLNTVVQSLDRTQQVRIPERLQAELAEYSTRFTNELNDDLNLPSALAVLFAFLAQANKAALTPEESLAYLAQLRDFDQVLDVMSESKVGFIPIGKLTGMADGASEASVALLGSEELSARLVETALAVRHACKGRADYARADAIRAQLTARKVEISDLKDGVRWRVVT